MNISPGWVVARMTISQVSDLAHKDIFHFVRFIIFFPAELTGMLWETSRILSLHISTNMSYWMVFGQNCAKPGFPFAEQNKRKKRLSTSIISLITFEQPFSCMLSRHLNFQLTTCNAWIFAPWASMWLFPWVRLLVHLQGPWSSASTWLQSNGFSSVCSFITWAFKWPFVTLEYSQIVHLCGFPPECVLLCNFRLFDLVVL